MDLSLKQRLLGAIVLIALAVMLYCDRDVAPVFGHLSPLAGEPHR